MATTTEASAAAWKRHAAQIGNSLNVTRNCGVDAEANSFAALLS